MENKKPAKKMKKTQKNTTQFTIDVDMRGLFVFILLALATAVVVFYLGVIFGKASRNPNAPPEATLQSPTGQKIVEDKISSKDLEIYNIRKDNDRVSSLKEDTKSVLQDADKLLNESAQEEPEPAVEPEVEQVKVESAQPQEEESRPWPEQSVPAKPGQELYTVQVFATKDKDKADRIVRQLRLQQFDAYLARVNIENQTIYRVRVGRTSKIEVEKLDQNLQKVIGGMGMKSRVMKIN